MTPMYAIQIKPTLGSVSVTKEPNPSAFEGVGHFKATADMGGTTKYFGWGFSEADAISDLQSRVWQFGIHIMGLPQ